jgi:hypothetical protein
MKCFDRLLGGIEGIMFFDFDFDSDAGLSMRPVFHGYFIL